MTQTYQPKSAANVIEFRKKTQSNLDASISSVMHLEETAPQNTFAISNDGWVYPFPSLGEMIESKEGRVVELFPGCMHPQQYKNWDCLNPDFLESENRAMMVRRNRAIALLKKKFHRNPNQMAAIQELEQINHRLGEGVFDIVDAEAAHHKKYALVVQAGLPVEYLKLDNSTWGIQSVNHMVIALGIASHKIDDSMPLRAEITPERLTDFQRLKDLIYSELDKAEDGLAEFCNKPNPSLLEKIGGRLGKLQQCIGHVLKRHRR